MIYNLVVINSESGNNVATIKLSEEGFDEGEGILMSGVVSAISNFLNELNIGNIRSFKTHQKQVIVYKKKFVLVVLICDENDEPDYYLPKIEYIANLFDNGCDWSNWCGDVSMFGEIIKTATNILVLSDDDLIEYINSSITEIFTSTEIILGYRIIVGGKIEKKQFRDIEDFELKSLITSEFIEDFSKNHADLIDNIGDLINVMDLTHSFIDYDRFSYFVYHFGSILSIVLYLPGKLNPINDIMEINTKLKNLGGMYGL
ncbi:MAG: hypothetical protein ACTSR8_16820 [Promethearchaeota archaeon]